MTNIPHNSNSTPQQQQDQLTTLPHDLFILILTKIRQQDFKFLVRCSLISKHFASSIPLMQHVSISISPPKSTSLDHPKTSLLQDIADRFIDRKMDYLTSLRPQIQHALLLLQQFKNIRSLHVLFTTDDHNNNYNNIINDNNSNNSNIKPQGYSYGFLPSLINWKSKFDFKLQSFVFLFANSVKTEQKTEEKTEENVMTTVESLSYDDVTDEELELRLYSSFHGVVDSIEWGNVMSRLLIQHPSLRDVMISGSTKGGKICLSRLLIQQIIDLRESLSPEDVLRIAGSGNGIGVTINVKSAYVSRLRLPKTGCVMNSVSLVVVRVGRRLCQPGDEDGVGLDSGTDSSDEDEEDGDGYVGYDDGDILGWDFEDDEEVFREAVSLILVHHKDKMKRET